MNEKITDFLTKIQPAALEIEAKTGIPWRFAAVQAGHESRWGESRLTVTANNLFGFTANEAWMTAQKPTAKFITTEFSDKPPEAIRYWTFPGDIFKKEKTPTGGSRLEVWRHFRRYGSWQESLDDWAGLMGKTRFAKALAGAKAGNFTEFAQGLSEGGYATDPKYAEKLVRLNSDIEGIA